MSAGGSNKMLSVQDVAEILAVSPDTIYDQWRQWGLKGYKIGKHLRFREREVEAWITQQAA
jgi:excisionase family DNA binding protein